MSVILDTMILKTKLSTKSKQVVPKTSTIFIKSLAISLSVVLLTCTAVVYIEGLRQFLSCRDNIVGYEQEGLYGDTEQFKFALSYCDSKWNHAIIFLCSISIIKTFGHSHSADTQKLFIFKFWLSFFILSIRTGDNL